MIKIVRSINLRLKKCSFLLLALVFFAGCENDKRVITISGITKDPKLNTMLEDVTVNLYTQKTSTGTFTYNFVKEGTTQSNAQGEFSFEFNFSYNAAFKLEMYKEDYFGNSVEFEMEEIPENDHYFNEFELYPEARIRFHLANNNPFDHNDMVQYQIQGWEVPCDGCCPSGYRSFTGIAIDETFECRVHGNEVYHIDFIVTKNGNSSFPQREVNCEAFTTQDVELIF
jgi:hypothetical protein